MGIKATNYRRILILSWFTILYNIAEGIISIIIGEKENTITLMGFGWDSLIECISAIGITHLIYRMKHGDSQEKDTFERNALRITGTCFYLLAFGLVAGAILQCIRPLASDVSWKGSIIALLSISTMWLLIRLKEKEADRLSSEAIRADAACARVCIYMSVILLISSMLFRLTGLHYIDAIGSLILSWFCFKEGRECFQKAKGNHSCSCSHSCEKTPN